MKRTLRNRTTPAWTGGSSRHMGAVLLVVAIGMVMTLVAFQSARNHDQHMRALHVSRDSRELSHGEEMRDCLHWGCDLLTAGGSGRSYVPIAILIAGLSTTTLLGFYFARNASTLNRTRSNERYLRELLDAIRTGVMVVDADTHQVVDANACALEMFGAPKERVVGHRCQRCISQGGEKCCASLALGEAVDLSERNILTADGRRVPVLKSVVAVEHDGRRFLIESFIDLTERKRAEAKLAELNGQLIDASRRAGMAELATSVLHNVGNVLNSVNVSLTVVTNVVKKSRTTRVLEVSELIRSHATDLGDFLTTDERGRRVPEYLHQLASHLSNEQSAILNELASLTKNIDHIKNIIFRQQESAHRYGIVETIRLQDVVEDALTVAASNCARDHIELVREFAEMPPVTIDRHRLLQILVNLLRNAKRALSDGQARHKRLVVQVAMRDDAHAVVVVNDNGIGIAPENLERVFTHGFTTKQDGHGFGLHSCILAAGDMGGLLTVHSDGPELGATFTLELPIRPVSVERGLPISMPTVITLAGAPA